MTIKLSTGLRNKLCGTTGFSGTFVNGVAYIYSGPQPLTADTAVSGTLLGIVTKNAGAFTFGVATNGLNFDSAANGIVSKAAADAWQFVGIAAGTAGYFRLMANATDNLGASTTLPRMDGTCGVTGADMNISNISIEIGTPNTVDVFTFTVPAQ